MGCLAPQGKTQVPKQKKQKFETLVTSELENVRMAGSRMPGSTWQQDENSRQTLVRRTMHAIRF